MKLSLLAALVLALAADARATTLFDNGVVGSPGSFWSNHVWAADDFAVPAGETWHVGAVEVDAYLSVAPRAMFSLTAVNVRILDASSGVSSNGLTTYTTVAEVLNAPYSIGQALDTTNGFEGHLIAVDLGEVVLSPGTYYVAINAPGSTGNASWSQTFQGSEAGVLGMIQSSNDGASYGDPHPEYQSSFRILSNEAPPADGAEVPEPAALGLGALGAAAIARRRRSGKAGIPAMSAGGAGAKTC
jgi:MYXO-CTERM domain-containing protein